MNFLKHYWIFLAPCLFVAQLAQAATAVPLTDSPPPIPATPVPKLKLGAPQPRDIFYFKLDTGVVFLRPPDKDNSNFQEAVNAVTPVEPMDGVNSVGSQSGDDTTWSLGGTIGFYLPAQPSERWLGRNLRVEISGNYYQTETTDNSGVSITPGGTFLNVGRLDGNYTGTLSSTDVGSVTGAANPVANEGLVTRDTLYQVGSAFRTDYIFDQGQLVLSPRLGFQYSNLDQNFHTTAVGNRGAVDQQEDVSTDYFGPTFGLELKVQLTPMFIYFFDGDMSPMYASSDYSGSQVGSSSRFAGGSGQNSATDSHDAFTFKAGAITGFYADLGPVKLKMGGGFEYWNYVASVQEAVVPAGVDSINDGVIQPPAHGPFSVQPSHLVSSDMLNPTIKVSVIVPF